jgi:hypothetical protein
MVTTGERDEIQAKELEQMELACESGAQAGKAATGLSR